MDARDNDIAVVERFFATLEAMDVDAFMALWADDGRQEMPFAPPGFPSVLDGKDAVRRQYGGLPEAYGRMVFRDLVVRPLADAGWVVAEYRGEIELLGGGSYNNRYCGLFHIDGGVIRLFREYFDPLVLQQSFGDTLDRTFRVPQEQ